ncbi:hypothetical protein AVEN_242653-1 [Araneus ventricosus]|uniref:Uncharacterized protein n=1 Tax=Araneus ventricosus TaxID=182803 RepID=A0A4Y2I8R6_ARAVE|nr:hypothetical protein AVEN_242653-1 [Araneus ventricosus]
MRNTDRANQRYVSRHQRLSIIRKLENESITEEKKENTNSRIPTIGKHNDQANSRVEMLQKWKQEKMVKKQLESKLKKPTFKVGVIKPNPPPSLGSKPLFALDTTSSRFLKSSFQVSNSHLSSKKQESLNASNTKTNAKVSNSQASAKKPEVDTVNIKTSAKDMKIQPSISKIVVPSKPESKSTRNKESGIQFLNTKPKVDTKSKVVNKDQVSSNRKQPTMGSKPPLETKKFESRLQPLSTRSKVTSLVRDAKSNIPSSGLPKATASRTLSTEPKQAIPKKNNAVKSIPKFSKNVASQQKGTISEKTSRTESKVPTKPESDYLTNKPNKATFECELSQIEPVKEQRKSFAPPGFTFKPPVELNSSLFLEDGPSAIFLRMKSQFLRTSTPKQSPSSQKSSSEAEDSKCLENGDTKSAKDEEKIEDAQCSKNADTKLGSPHKYDLEAVLSSSLESVYLNDVKAIDCKQFLKFEFPEVVSTQNREEVLLSSKITHPELSLATKMEPAGAINPPILPDSVEIDKTEINSADTRPADDNKITIPLPEADSALSEVIPDPTYIVKPIDYKQSLKFEFPEVVSTQNREEVLLSSNIMYPEHSLAGGPIPGGAINPPIPADSVEVDKTEINSTGPEDDSKITVPFPEVDSEVIPDPTYTESDENTERNRSVPNGFLQKLENGLHKIPERKIRNFKRSEKPGLSSINESLENTPKSALKKKVVDSVFTPRRSLRLAKLSGNFSSLENLLDTPKQKENKDKVGLKGDFTPRRSLRLSKFSTEFSSAENLFDVRRPTLYGTPEEDKAVPKLKSRVTYDFDRLSAETEEETRPHTTRAGKISLLYTPPNNSRPSIMRHSIKGDLMSFSPNV